MVREGDFAAVFDVSRPLPGMPEKALRTFVSAVEHGLTRLCYVSTLATALTAREDHLTVKHESISILIQTL
jgi:hypothetical protein